MLPHFCLSTRQWQQLYAIVESPPTHSQPCLYTKGAGKYHVTMAIADLAIIGYQEATNYRDISYNRYYRSGLVFTLKFYSECSDQLCWCVQLEHKVAFLVMHDLHQLQWSLWIRHKILWNNKVICNLRRLVWFCKHRNFSQGRTNYVNCFSCVDYHVCKQ